MTPAAIAERRHPFRAVRQQVPLLMPSAKKADAKKQMLMYGNVELPAENFSFKKESGAPQCEEGCAFQDKVFTVEVRARAGGNMHRAACGWRARSAEPYPVRQ